MNVGVKLQQLRKSKGMSQQQLASELGVSRQAISKWELGEAVPGTENVVQLSKLFSVSTDHLLKDELDSHRNIPDDLNAPHNLDAPIPMATTDNTTVYKQSSDILMKVISYTSFGLGFLGIITFLILSSVFPARTSTSTAAPYNPSGIYPQPVVRNGLWAFLEIHKLQFLFVLCCSLILVGIVLFIRTAWINKPNHN